MDEGLPKNKIESSELKQLRELEATGKYVFHGTNADVEKIEPRQAVDDQTGKDDKPGIHASDVVDFSIFAAIASPGRHTRFGATEESDSGEVNIHYEVEEDDIGSITDDTTGWVYVFERNDFKKRSAIEWICYKPLQPKFKIKVAKADLPEGITTFKASDD